VTSETKLPKAELWVATGLRGLETHQPNHVVGVSRDEVNEEVKSAHGPGWAVWMTEPYFTAEQMQAYASAAVEQASEPDGYTSFGEFRWACDCTEQMKREWQPLYTTRQENAP
jgi:hypothetical protein